MRKKWTPSSNIPLTQFMKELDEPEQKLFLESPELFIEYTEEDMKNIRDGKYMDVSTNLEDYSEPELSKITESFVNELNLIGPERERFKEGLMETMKQLKACAFLPDEVFGVECAKALLKLDKYACLLTEGRRNDVRRITEEEVKRLREKEK